MKMWKFPVMIVLAVIMIIGCSRRYLIQDEGGNVLGTADQMYRVLSFFFDDVPPPSKPGEGTEENGGKAAPERKAPDKTLSTEHGPYAAKMCEGCHLRGGNRLVAPVEELCYYCHTFRTDKRMIHGPLASGGCRVCHEPHSSGYRYLLTSRSGEFCFDCHNRDDIVSREIHRDVTGGCTTCHDPHMSDNDFLLR